MKKAFLFVGCGLLALAPLAAKAADSAPYSGAITALSNVMAAADAALAAADVVLSTALPGQVFVGNASSQAVAVAVSGDATLAATGEISLVETQALTKIVEGAHRVVTSYSASSRVCVDFQSGLSNGVTYTYAVGALAAVPGITATYSTTSTAQSPTSSVEVISKTISNCVIVCQEGCTVDLTLIGVR